MLTISPVAQFQQTRAADAEKLFDAVRTPWFTTALCYAMSEMAVSGATKEELTGARIYMAALMNLSEPIPKPKPPLPSKELGQPDKPTQEE